jgi:hypothetical protein
VVCSNGLPNVVVGDLVFHGKTRLLRAATRSRGVWELDCSAESAGEVEIYLRHSAIDTGRKWRAEDGVADPFVPGGIAHWCESTDILIDSEPYRAELPAEDFVGFEEYRRADRKAAHGQTRVYVQVHQRGPVAAANAVVWLFWAWAEDRGIPDLPAGFWDKAPANRVPAGSAWGAVAPSLSSAGLQVGQPKVAAFEWNVPTTGAGYVWLLAMVAAGNDELKTTELKVEALVRAEAKCAIQRIAVGP